MTSCWKILGVEIEDLRKEAVGNLVGKVFPITVISAVV